MAEKSYHESRDVWIGSARAVFGNKTFALASVTSVEGNRLPPDRNPALFVILFGAMALFASVPIYDHSGLGGVFCLLIGLLLIGSGTYWASRIMPRFVVVLITSAGERRAYVSTSEDEIIKIVNALNTAIVERG